MTPRHNPAADPEHFRAQDIFAPTRRVNPTYNENPPIVEGSPFGYKEGMKTEVRTAPRWREALTAFHVHLRARKLAPGTIYIRMYHLRVMSQSFRGQSPWTLTTTDIESYLASNDHLGKSTLHSMISSIRKLYAWGYRERYTNFNVALDVEPINGPDGVPRPAADPDIRAALDRADPRAKLAIQIGAFCGLRVSEISRVNTRDVFHDSYGRPMLRVLGKGDKTRDVPLPHMLASIIQNAPAGWVFPSQKGTDTHLLPGSLGDIMRRALPEHITPHMLRHRYASTHYAASKDIRAVQTVLGHSSVKTTQTYTAVPDESIFAGAAAAGMLAS